MIVFNLRLNSGLMKKDMKVLAYSFAYNTFQRLKKIIIVSLKHI